MLGDSIIRKTDRALSGGGGRRGGLLSMSKNRGYHREGGKNRGSGQGRFYFTRRN